MGSNSDLPIMQEAIDILKGFDIEVEVDIVSAHRTPDKLFDYGKNAHQRGISVIIAGAGGASLRLCRFRARTPSPSTCLQVRLGKSFRRGWRCGRADKKRNSGNATVPAIQTRLQPTDSYLEKMPRTSASLASADDMVAAASAGPNGAGRAAGKPGDGPP